MARVTLAGGRKSPNPDRPPVGIDGRHPAQAPTGCAKSPALVLPDKEGKPYTLRYDAVNAMLLNEFLKEHRKVEKLEVTIAQQHRDFEATVAELKGQIQKVSARLEVSKATPQTVLNNR